MVSGWRRAFCTTIPRDEEKQDNTTPIPGASPRLGSKFKFFSSSSSSSSSSSNPSTPRLPSHEPISSPNNMATYRCKTAPPTPSSRLKPETTLQIQDESPKLQCKTAKNSPRFFSFSNPSSPRSPSTFSFLKSSLHNSKTRCCICLKTIKTGQGVAIFTAECSHSFHFPCIAAHIHKESSLSCPVCSSTWKEMPILSIHNVDNSTHNEQTKPSKFPRTIHVENMNTKPKSNPTLKVYNDDEPLISPTSGGRFDTIPESDEENENVAFGGFVNNSRNVNKDIEVRLSPDMALISGGRTSETYAIVMKVKGSSALGNSTARRAPIDLVTVLDVSSTMGGDKLVMMKKTMRMLLASLSGHDRLSIVAFSSVSKRVLPLRRMTAAGRRSARRIVESVVEIEGASVSSTDALKKAVKVLEDRREKNPVTSIVLLSFGEDDCSKQSRLVTSSRIPHLDISVHTIALGHEGAGKEDLLSRSIGNILSVFVQDISIRLGFISGSAHAEIAAVYENTNPPEALGSGLIRLGELYAEEERELLVEIKVPKGLSITRSHRVLAVRCSYKDPFTQEVINCREQALIVPRFEAVRSSGRGNQRLRSVFIASRALAEARRLVERNELSGAHHMLASARALLLQSSPGSSDDEFVRALESELSEVSTKKLSQPRDVPRRGLNVERDMSSGIVYLDDKAEPLTPTSAWRAAEKLAKLAIMRKSMHRVSDLHGFENARF